MSPRGGKRDWVASKEKKKAEIKSCNLEMYSTPSLSVGDTFQDSQRMPETADSTEPCIYYVLSYKHVPTIKFNL